MVVTRNDFYEEDEDPKAVRAAFDAGSKGVTANPGAWVSVVTTTTQPPVTTGSGAATVLVTPWS